MFVRKAVRLPGAVPISALAPTTLAPTTLAATALSAFAESTHSFSSTAVITGSLASATFTAVTAVAVQQKLRQWLVVRCSLWRLFLCAARPARLRVRRLLRERRALPTALAATRASDYAAAAATCHATALGAALTAAAIASSSLDPATEPATTTTAASALAAATLSAAALATTATSCASTEHRGRRERRRSVASTLRRRLCGILADVRRASHQLQRRCGERRLHMLATRRRHRGQTPRIARVSAVHLCCNRAVSAADRSRRRARRERATGWRAGRLPLGSVQHGRAACRNVPSLSCTALECRARANGL